MRTTKHGKQWKERWRSSWERESIFAADGCHVASGTLLLGMPATGISIKSRGVGGLHEEATAGLSWALTPQCWGDEPFSWPLSHTPKSFKSLQLPSLPGSPPAPSFLLDPSICHTLGWTHCFCTYYASISSHSPGVKCFLFPLTLPHCWVKSCHSVNILLIQ